MVTAGLPAVEMRDEPCEEGVLGLRDLVAERGRLGVAILALLRAGEVGEDELGVDDLDVAHRIDRAADVVDVLVLETPHDLHDRVHLADVGKELVAKALAAARPAHQSGDVDELDGGRDELLRTAELAEHLEPGIGHGDDAHVRVNRAKRVVGRLRLACAGDGVEQGGFAHVGQSDDTGA